jgi:hypothetical protein
MVRRNRANHPFVSSRTNHWMASGKGFVRTDISNIGETFLNSSRFCFYWSADCTVFPSAPDVGSGDRTWDQGGHNLSCLVRLAATHEQPSVSVGS